jgi:predicted enzyme related to lactoylglutathione lyase
MPPKYVNGQVSYIEIPAIDIQRSADFYVKVFGWRITKRADGSTGFEDSTGQLSGTWVVGRPPATEIGLLVFIVVDDVTSTLDVIFREGGDIVRSIGTETPEIGRFHDPGGNVFGLFQIPNR